jgi:hypothetical protein
MHRRDWKKPKRSTGDDRSEKKREKSEKKKKKAEKKLLKGRRSGEVAGKKWARWYARNCRYCRSCLVGSEFKS